MSCEESYLAIIRYLTDEKEPYAPGTPGNTKRKIRKAAVCYVVRDGTLYYQRRLKGQDDFTELEVVLQDERKKELITRAHISDTGEHLNQQATWDILSPKYWWRGILKSVKDELKECTVCQSRRTEEGLGRATGRPLGRPRRKLCYEDDEEDEEDDFSERQASRHELVFVDSKGEVNQFLPKHSGTMLDKLNHQRLNNQFCDITLLIEGEEFRAHKAVLAACSDYFHQLFFEKGAASTHEAVVDLFTKASFLPLLDFAYTSSLTFNFCVMADIANLARHLLMSEVLQICESVHKKVEQQKMTVYQRGDVHTVMATHEPELSCGEEAEEAERPEQQTVPVQAADTTYVVAIDSNGSAVAVTPEQLAFVADKDFIQHPVAVVAPGDGEGAGQVTLIAHAQPQPGETVTLISAAEALEADAMTVVTHSGQAGASDSLAVVSACLALEQQPDSEQTAPGQTYVISVDSQRGSEDTPTEPAPQPEVTPPPAEAPPPQPQATPPPEKRKRGHPAKAKKEVCEEPVPEEEEAPEDSPEPQDQGRRLRHRHITEGGYARLHTGTHEDEEEEEETAGDEGESDTPLGRLLLRPSSQTSRREQCSRGGAQEEGAGPVPKQDRASDSAVDGEHACSECGMSFPRRYALIMHTLKHEKARTYKCSLCSKEFQYAASLRTHLARHKQQSSQQRGSSRVSERDQDQDLQDAEGRGHTTREFVCDICGKTLPKLYSLRLHMLSHTGVRPHSCKVCGKTFAYKNNLKMHRLLHDKSKHFKCPYCHKTFVSKRSMEDHTSLHTGQSKYQCNSCGATFHRASALSKHMKKHQPKPDVRPYACTHCDKSFFEAKDLQQHMNKHMGLKPFQCQVCGKCYSWKKDWYSHVKSHSVAEPYKCNVCGKEFFEKSLFRRHVKKATHGKKGRVKQNLERECAQCGRKFTQLREYRRHVNNHQGVKPFECLTCGVAWRTLALLSVTSALTQESVRHAGGARRQHPGLRAAPELRQPQPSAGEEIETVLITEETVEAVEAVQAAVQAENVSTLSDQGIMQVVNYVLAQQALSKDDSPEIIQTMEVEVAHVAEVE
ncbi:hypothetical protein WMY93_024374 [Mugilogobius chulae]|uniref:Zinc finger and BTB domain-containing protein 11 n=1 Tax=Mugilogobius chulae TaxID=88201 RepID=A0AAW0N515_9GOBI